MRLRTIFTVLAVAFINLSSALAANQVELRFFPRALDPETSSMYVDIEVRTSDNTNLVLAGQNYRIFYDTKMLKLESEQSVSKLPGNKYTDLVLLENFENINAHNVGQLNFDENLGFANFSVELKDNLNGGIVLSKKDGWKTVATLKFKMLKSNGEFRIIWGREGRSTEYATAFVEMAEWVEPLKTANLNILEYYDLDYTRSILTAEDERQEGKLTIGPNPATDFLNISLENELQENSELIIKDVIGRVVKSLNIANGIKFIHVDVTDLTPATYLIELQSEKAGRHFTEQFIVSD